MYAQSLTTSTAAPALIQIGGSNNVDIYGVLASAQYTTAYYVKFWWSASLSAATVPTLGTSIPNLVVPISSGGPGFVNSRPILAVGPVFFAATSSASVADTAALGAGGDIISLLLG